jgi:hypothetical protein
MEQIPIGDGERPDNVVPLPGSFLEPELEPEPESDPTPASEPGTTDPAIGPLLEQSARILLGFVSATSAAFADALRGIAPRPLSEDGELPDDGTAPARPNAAGLTAGAATGLAIEVTQAAVKAATSFAETAGPMMSWVTNAPVIRQGLTDVEETARDLNDRWTRERPVSEGVAAAFAATVIPELTNAILDRIDLTQIAIDRIDVDRIVDTIDLDAIVERVDLDAVIRRVDLAGIATEVIGEIDLPELIRESTGAVTSETVRTVRLGSAELDRLLGRVVDRLLNRKRAEEGNSDPAERDAEGSLP